MKMFDYKLIYVKTIKKKYNLEKLNNLKFK